jgi:hypothetical protein
MNAVRGKRNGIGGKTAPRYLTAAACLARALAGEAPTKKAYANRVKRRPLREAISFLLEHLEGVRAGHTRKVKVAPAGVKVERGGLKEQVGRPPGWLWVQLYVGTSSHYSFHSCRLDSLFSSGSSGWGTYSLCIKNGLISYTICETAGRRRWRLGTIVLALTRSPLTEYALASSDTLHIGVLGVRCFSTLSGLFV